MGDIKQMFEQKKIVPDVIDEAPFCAIRIVYPSGKEVNLGAELTPTEVKDQPKVQWEAIADKWYLLLMVDPDASSDIKPKLHWLVANIKGDNLSSGDVIVPYVGSGAPKGSGLHRYTFLIYEQNQNINPKINGRNKFSTRNFLKNYSVGKLVAGNFFMAQWDEYVEVLKAKST